MPTRYPLEPIAGVRRPRANRLMRVFGHSVAPGLVLLTPFIVFLKYQGYDYARPEILVCFATLVVTSLALGAVGSTLIWAEVLMLAAVLTFFVDVQFVMAFWIFGIGKAKALAAGFIMIVSVLWVLRAHAARLITIMAGTALVSTFLLPSTKADQTAPAQSAATLHDLPLLVHLVLDEHIGIEGIPSTGSLPTLHSDLQSFYQTHGFRLFGAAYSEHKFTPRSLAHLFNFSPGQYVAELVQPGTSRFTATLQRNDYLTFMAQQGYRLRVYQSNYLNLCPHESKMLTCDTYDIMGLAVLEDLPLRVSEKARLVGGGFLVKSKIVTRVKHWYDAVSSKGLGIGIHLPSWEWSYWMSTFNSMAETERLKGALSRAHRGELFLAHLLVPHSPFVHDASCNTLPLDQWVRGSDGSVSIEDRSARYASYDLQVRCTTRIVRDILEAIPAPLRREAIVIVQGDHGSRLAFLNARDSGAGARSIADYSDDYSTLFAVRAAGLKPSYDTQPVPITCLLKTLVVSKFQSVAELDACAQTPVVFLGVGSGRTVPTPLPIFGRTGQ